MNRLHQYNVSYQVPAEPREIGRNANKITQDAPKKSWYLEDVELEKEKIVLPVKQQCYEDMVDKGKEEASEMVKIIRTFIKNYVEKDEEAFWTKEPEMFENVLDRAKIYSHIEPPEKDHLDILFQIIKALPAYVLHDEKRDHKNVLLFLEKLVLLDIGFINTNLFLELPNIVQSGMQFAEKMTGLFGKLLKNKWMMTEKDYKASLLDFLEKTPKRNVQAVGEVLKQSIKKRKRWNEDWLLSRNGVMRIKEMIDEKVREKLRATMNRPIAKAARRNKVIPGTTTQ